jgi:hypothetical protein
VGWPVSEVNFLGKLRPHLAVWLWADSSFSILFTILICLACCLLQLRMLNISYTYPNPGTTDCDEFTQRSILSLLQLFPTSGIRQIRPGAFYVETVQVSLRVLPGDDKQLMGDGTCKATGLTPAPCFLPYAAALLHMKHVVVSVHKATLSMLLDLLVCSKSWCQAAAMHMWLRDRLRKPLRSVRGWSQNLPVLDHGHCKMFSAMQKRGLFLQWMQWMQVSIVCFIGTPSNQAALSVSLQWGMPVFKSTRALSSVVPPCRNHHQVRTGTLQAFQKDFRPDCQGVIGFGHSLPYSFSDMQFCPKVFRGQEGLFL